MSYLFCYLLVFAAYIFIIEYIVPLKCETRKQVDEDFRLLKQMLKSNDSKVIFAVIFGVLVYLLIIHLLTIATLYGIEWLAKVFYA